jgi:hypothetical protein
MIEMISAAGGCNMTAVPRLMHPATDGVRFQLRAWRCDYRPLSAVRRLTPSRDAQRCACASQWASCSDWWTALHQQQTEGRRPNPPMRGTLEQFPGGGGVDLFLGSVHTQTQLITTENSYDLGCSSEGEFVTSTSRVLLDKPIVSQLANKFPEF